MNKVRFVISLLLLPLLLVLGYNFLQLFFSFASKTNFNIVPFWLGIGVYILFQFVFFKPMSTYVFGHEFTHALAGILSGAQIKKFKVSKNGGSVTLNKDNIFITLSPYFFPLYSIIIIVVYFALAWFTDTTKLYSWFLFFSGAALAFHYALTFYAIKIGQEDMRVYGKFFSLVFVCFVNIIMVVFVLAWIFPDMINITDFFVKVFYDGVDFYKYIFTGVYKCLAFLKTK
ncbi:MAG: hypothetical protein II816_07575 [Elusimicrobia bacterium]|nr:hypothetical protein [Elusimicrobiota bacterium]